MRGYRVAIVVNKEWPPGWRPAPFYPKEKFQGVPTPRSITSSPAPVFARAYYKSELFPCAAKHAKESRRVQAVVQRCVASGGTARATVEGNADEVGEHEVGNTCAGGHDEKVSEERVVPLEENRPRPRWECNKEAMVVIHRCRDGISRWMSKRSWMKIRLEEERVVGRNGEQAGWKQDCQNGVAFLYPRCSGAPRYITDTL
ncbi:hypothetical protein EDB86DRAFT_2830693 [Lactarius hatsudake]|nr:hypothetical protein EDB86DRAFT_2830693 [Lactarius hatsudake]